MRLSWKKSVAYNKKRAWHLTLSWVRVLSNKLEFFVSCDTAITKTSFFLLSFCMFWYVLFYKNLIALYHSDNTFLFNFDSCIKFTLSTIILTMKNDSITLHVEGGPAKPFFPILVLVHTFFEHFLGAYSENKMVLARNQYIVPFKGVACRPGFREKGKISKKCQILII